MMMLRNTKSSGRTLVVFVVLVASIGCNASYIREVRRTQTGGEIALTNSTKYHLPFAQAEAKEAMTARCPLGYEIIEEGEVAVGQHSSATTTEHPGGILSGPSQTTTATTENRNEWHIKYQCKGEASAPMLPVAPASGAPAPAAMPSSSSSASPRVPQATRANSGMVYKHVIR